jgi:hypothetical protein
MAVPVEDVLGLGKVECPSDIGGERDFGLPRHGTVRVLYPLLPSTIKQGVRRRGCRLVRIP